MEWKGEVTKWGGGFRLLSPVVGPNEVDIIKLNPTFRI